MENTNEHVAGAVLHLGRRVRAAGNQAELGFIIVNESRQLIDYRQSALCLQDSGTIALSGIPATERDAPYTQWLKLLTSRLSPQPRALSIDLAAAPEEFGAAVLSDWQDWWPEHALAVPLRAGGPDGEQIGWWLLARDTPWSESEIEIADELAAIFAHALRFFRRSPGWRTRLQRWLAAGKQRKQKVAIAIAVFLLFPVRLTVMAPADVTPKDAFPVRAPLEGAVDIVHVRPNQPVVENQALFDLDTTGLRTRLSVARKAFDAASEEYRQAAQLAVSDDDKGRLEMSQRRSRMEEKAAELAYSEQLLDRVQVKAPRAGVAVFTDATEWIGRAVVIGERVMQIADPKRVEITIRLPVADVLDFPADAKVTLYLNNASQFSYDARLSYMAYKPEVSADGLVAYKLKAGFVDGEAVPRLGLTGTAKIHAGWAPLVYYVMRRPLATARQWIGW